MKLGEIMIVDVVQIAPEETIRKAARRMRERSIGCLLATVDGSIKGIITDRDLLGCLDQEHDPNECSVSKHMARPVIVERPEEDVTTAADVMRRNLIKRLPVLDDGKLVGIVSFSDIAAALHAEAERFRPTWKAITSLMRAQAFQKRGAALGAEAEAEEALSDGLYVRKHRATERV
jgi:CBS domain-containing protein